MAPDPAQDPPPAGWVLCPGCRQRSGPPGALCPDCGSRLPQPQKAESAGALLAIGLVVGAIGYAIYAASGHGSFGAVVLLIGIIVFGVGLAQGSDVAGRIGPERQASCCGCSCAVALLVVPVGAALLWMQGGPALAALAVPAWVPASWAMAQATRLGFAIRSFANRCIWPHPGNHGQGRLAEYEPKPVCQEGSPGPRAARCAWAEDPEGA